MAVAVPTPQQAQQPTNDIVDLWRTRITQARTARKPFEKVWLSNLAFDAGQFWLAWDDTTQSMRHLSQLDPRYSDRELYTSNRIREYVQAQLGELESDDDRPQLLTAQEGETAEQSAKALNDAVAYAWEHEWDADEVIAQARRAVLTLGTVAIRRRFDKNKGPIRDPYQPVDPTGQLVADPQNLASLREAGTLASGGLPTFQPVHEGRSVLDVYTPFGILAPPGVNHEGLFPWEILVRPVPLDTLAQDYTLPPDLTEDTDIASAMGLSIGQTVRDTRSQGAATSSRLRGHVWLYTCFERPCKKYPTGRVVVLASNDYVLLDQQDTFDYKLPNGDVHSGVVYLHWWRANDRFYSTAFIEPMKDPQRAINELETVKVEIGRRGLPKVIVKKGSVPDKPQGSPLEVIEMDDLGAAPIFHPGIGPGDWMNVEKAGHVDNLSHASTLSPLRLGENPQNVDTYSQLALINENEAGKRTVIVRSHRRAIADLVEIGVHDIRRYWPERKLVYVTGDDDSIARVTFEKAQIPDFFMVKVAKGAAQPRSQAAEFKRIDAIWAAAVECGIAVTSADAWVAWFVDSYAAGSALEIPETPRGSQQELAAFENLLMKHGQQVQAADYDIITEHLPEHREAMDDARAAGDMNWYGLIAAHVQSHIQMAQQNAARVAAAQQIPGPGPLAAAAASPPVGPQAGPPSPSSPGGAPNPVYAARDFTRLSAGN